MRTNARIRINHSNHLGSPRKITNQSGNIVWQWLEKPFGDSPVNQDPDNDGIAFEYNLRFPGQYFDKETGLHYNYHRYYDSQIGRYITSDPIGLDGGLNAYSYVFNNPLEAVDFKGLSPKSDAAKWIFKKVWDGCKWVWKMIWDKADDAAKQPQKLPKTRAELEADLLSKGYTNKGTSPNGYTTYKGPDGRTVTVKPDGEVIPVQRVWKEDGSGKFPQRQDYQGNPLPDQSHSTGHYVE